METLNDACPKRDTGVYKMPFNPTLLRLKEASVSFIKLSLVET
jgi:hypothetical protein